MQRHGFPVRPIEDNVVDDEYEVFNINFESVEGDQSHQFLGYNHLGPNGSSY